MGSPLLWVGSTAKLLKSIFDINGNAQIHSGSVDPTSVATSAPKGSIYLNTSTGLLYRKTDAGSSTNWISTAATSLSSVTAVKTANYSITTADDAILGNSTGGTFTFTLPTAAGNTGKAFFIKKTDSSFTAISIATTSSQTIDGVTTTSLNTQNEALILISDGANWYVRDRYIPSAWTSYTMTIGGVTTAPTKGTIVRDEARWRRVGDSMEIVYNFEQSSAGTIGSGVYLFPLPSGTTIDTAKQSVTGNSLSTSIVGTSAAGAGSVASNALGIVKAYNSSNLAMIVDNNTTKDAINDGYYPLNSAGTRSYSFTAKVPISGWNG